MTTVAARLDPQLQAVLSDLAPLRYGRSPRGDVPDHVRAASAVRRLGERLVIVQDDVNALALQARDGHPEALLLPVGPGGRRVFGDESGNKHHKMDLEAGVTLPDGRLLALGSGSTPARETVVVVTPDEQVQTVHAPALYATLRAETAFAGSELNVEGAVVVGDVLRLFQRGNGAPRAGLEPVNATGDVPLEPLLAWLDGRGPLPPLGDVVAYQLGRIGPARLGFTDAALLPDGRVAFLACAEDSPDAVADGDILGCRFGLIEDAGARMADVVHADGTPTRHKLEGLEHAGAGAFHVVADMDRPDEPSLLGRLTTTER